MVTLSDQAKLICVGSVLNDRYILTAAHCLEDFKGNSMTLTAGLSRLEMLQFQRSLGRLGVQKRTISKSSFKTHPKVPITNLLAHKV